MQQSITYIPNNTGMMTMSKETWTLYLGMIIWKWGCPYSLVPFNCLRPVVVQLPSHIRLSMTPWTAAHQASLSLTISQSLPKFISIESLMPSISSSATFFSSCPQSFPASGSLPVSWLFASGGQRIGASTSASVLLMSIQGWFPLKLTSLMPLLFKGLSRIFSKHYNSKASILWHSAFLLFSSTSIHD